MRLMNQWTRVAVIAALAGAATAGAEDGAALGAAALEKDRQAILAMVGDFKVSFQFDETLTLVEGAEPSEAHRSSALEVVRVVEDRGTFISLQHLLVVGAGEEASVVKHWRQDWAYESPTVLTFAGDMTWSAQPVPAGEKGYWTQTVFQVDDSPRYGGFGRWVHVEGYAYWDSNETWRPLPRREHTKRDDYDVLVGRNRHAVTAQGWTHEQDNYKLALRDGGRRIVARETGLNRYERTESPDIAVAVAYWEKTAPFWAAVRDTWSAHLTRGGNVKVLKTESGRDIHTRILKMADRFAEGEFGSVDTAKTEVSQFIAEHVGKG
jgi:hypothetical protein